MADITRKRSRDALAVRREPYWQRLTAGAYLGFRRGPDTWIGRFRDRNGKQQYKAVGEQLDYDEAKKLTEEWLDQMTNAPLRSAKRDTVKAALGTYLADLRRHGRVDAAKEAEGRFKLTIYKDPIADIELEQASKDDFLEWRDRLQPGRQPRSINRHVRSVVAGLNKANDLGHVGNPRAWLLEPLQDNVEDDGDTAVYLTAEQRQALIAVASENAGAFLRGLELTGARPKELAAAFVKDYGGGKLKLSHRKGRPPKLRTRYVILGADDAVAFFDVQVKRKLPGAPIFTEDGETPWRRHVWAREVRAAIAAHNTKARVKGKARIPVEASAYSFRHARISELLQIHGVDPLTVAAQTGTSLAVIEKTYLKFIPSALLEKLKAVK